MTAPRVTIRDIAAKAGVHYSTVSLALRNSEEVSEETKKKITQLVAEMGYRPDPLVRSLAAYRHLKNVVYQREVAWINGQFFPKTKERWYEPYFEGANKIAEKNGYKLTEFFLDNPQTSLKKLPSILQARNISGVIWAPQWKGYARINFPWNDFTSVTFGYSILKPEIHMATNHHFFSAFLAMKKLRGKGYKRIGYLAEEAYNSRMYSQILGGYLVQREKLKPKDRISPLIEKEISKKSFQQWYEKYKPDAILTNLLTIKTYAEELGIRIPQGLGIAFTAIDNKEYSGCSGICQRMSETGEKAMEYLIGCLYQNQKGVPEVPVNLLVRGYWKDGKTTI